MQTPSEMKDRMLELARKDGYIDSIFNYCDRWCERCPLTSKCRNYAFGKDEPSACINGSNRINQESPPRKS